MRLLNERDNSIQNSVECGEVGDIRLNASDQACCFNMETILEHYFSVLWEEDNHISEFDLEKAYDALSATDERMLQWV